MRDKKVSIVVGGNTTNDLGDLLSILSRDTLWLGGGLIASDLVSFLQRGNKAAGRRIKKALQAGTKERPVGKDAIATMTLKQLAGAKPRRTSLLLECPQSILSFELEIRDQDPGCGPAYNWVTTIQISVSFSMKEVLFGVVNFLTSSIGCKVLSVTESTIDDRNLQLRDLL